MNGGSSASGKKIVFLNRYFFPDQSATSQILSYLSFALAKNHLPIHVLCSRQGYDLPQANLPAREQLDGVQVHRIWTSHFGRDRLLGRALDYITFYICAGWKLLGLLRRGDVVVAMTDPPLISIVAMFAAKLKRAHLVNWLQDIFPEVASRLDSNPLPRSVDRMVRWLRNATLRHADINVVLGARMGELLQQSGIPTNRIRIIENWAHFEAGAPKTTAASALRASLGFGEKFIVGYSGNLGRAHDFRTVLEAASLLTAEREIVFLMIGSGAGMKALKQAAAERGAGNFCFLPYQPQESLPDSLAAADVHWVSLQPSLEGLIVPSKVYGILAAARPVIFIGDRDGEVARLIESGAAGLSVTPGDAQELARRILRLKADDDERGRMGRNGLALYRNNFTPERALARWLEILEPHASSVRS
jgi:glycosyltransferase involved in cell wall biosynthesis